MVNRLSNGDKAPQAPTAIPASTSVDFLSLLRRANRDRFLQGSMQAVYPAGSIPLRPGGPSVACLIDAGLARAFWSLPDGRQTTLAVIRPREFVGSTASMRQSNWMFMQLITECTLTILDLENVRALAATELEVASAIGRHLGMRVRDAYRLIAVRSLGNIRERVAYDLLDRAAQSQLVVGRLEVIATQADLADSIGSSREVMSRALRDMRAEGIVETAPGLIRVLDPERLAAIVRAFVI
ncbi:MAG TPA: Crp/Fnr family transcriptional regulator [Candidatus Acidoferrum sp.]|jgi:CRP/FNR family cyclic AMP-dependent transcriptional regulator|nr:Crp/Fnr family transcriptional regulator [Candidatus Acidoferrum sp.]